MKILVGIGLGIIITIFYPDIVPHVKTLFLESCVRDSIVSTLQSMKQEFVMAVALIVFIGIIVANDVLSVIVYPQEKR